MKALLLSAGLGTRLKPFTDHKPKALAVVNRKTLLERNIRYLASFGVDEVIVNVHHFGDMIIDFIANNEGFGSRVAISDERDAVLETGGGLKNAAPFFTGEQVFVVMNVDVLTNLDLGAMIAAHSASGAIATLAVMQRHSARQFLFDAGMHLCGWANSNTGEQRISREVLPLHPFAFSGIQVLSGEIFDLIPFDGKFSLVDVYLHIAKTRMVKGFDHTGSLFTDVGKPESITLAEKLFS